MSCSCSVCCAVVLFLVVFGPDAVTTYDHKTCLNPSLTVTKMIQQLTNQRSRMYVGIYPGYSAFLSPEDARRGAGRCARAGQNSPETSDHRSRGDGFRHLETVGLSVELRPIASPAVTEHAWDVRLWRWPAGTGRGLSMQRSEWLC